MFGWTTPLRSRKQFTPFQRHLSSTWTATSATGRPTILSPHHHNLQTLPRGGWCLKSELGGKRPFLHSILRESTYPCSRLVHWGVSKVPRCSSICTRRFSRSATRASICLFWSRTVRTCVAANTAKATVSVNQSRPPMLDWNQRRRVGAIRSFRHSSTACLSLAAQRTAGTWSTLNLGFPTKRPGATPTTACACLRAIFSSHANTSHEHGTRPFP
jgi:hypothetical protein